MFNVYLHTDRRDRSATRTMYLVALHSLQTDTLGQSLYRCRCRRRRRCIMSSSCTQRNACALTTAAGHFIYDRHIITQCIARIPRSLCVRVFVYYTTTLELQHVHHCHFSRSTVYELARRHSAAQLCKILHTNAAAAAAAQTYRIAHILKIVKTNRDIVERAAEASSVMDFVSLADNNWRRRWRWCGARAQRGEQRQQQQLGFENRKLKLQ
ncbi:unnamed protein product [Trichogramma brassicae]|uniref:Uncharacterized protein n=1 Tax=Trichogramma brassicae TaxID=86971 RepID=A0A6H5J364_9HYME|nr:unnamed protein product [Trichogramma brassicae]